MRTPFIYEDTEGDKILFLYVCPLLLSGVKSVVHFAMSLSVFAFDFGFMQHDATFIAADGAEEVEGQHLGGTALHSQNVFNSLVFMGIYSQIMVFVTLDEYLLIQQQEA